MTDPSTPVNTDALSYDDDYVPSEHDDTEFTSFDPTIEPPVGTVLRLTRGGNYAVLARLDGYWAMTDTEYRFWWDTVQPDAVSKMVEAADVVEIAEWRKWK